VIPGARSVAQQIAPKLILPRVERANVNRSKGNRASSKQGLKPGFGNRKLLRGRTFLLFTLFFLVISIFVWSGGIAGFGNAMASRALANKNPVAADWWLSLSKAISSDPHSDFLRARSARQQGNLELMSSCLKSAFDQGYAPLKLQREQTLALVNMGQMTGEMEQEINRWLREPDVEVSEVVDAYSNGLVSLSRFEEARKLLYAWERDYPLSPLPNYRLARIHEHLNESELAEAEYRKATKKSPKFVNAKYSLARLLLRQRRPAEAMEFYRECDLGPSALAAKTGMAQCYKSLGEIEKARALLKAVLVSDQAEIQRSFLAVDESPERFVAASELGCIETEIGHFSEGKEYLERALASFPLDSIARYSYAVALRGLGMKKEADENFERTRATRLALDQVTALQERINTNPRDSQSRIKIGKIILENESERTGVYWISSVFSYDPGNLEAHSALVDYYEGKGDDKSKYKQLIDYHRSFIPPGK
jgi:tetratricopeptide (TPR) repeat protein